jgi:uncharacterized protein
MTPLARSLLWFWVVLLVVLATGAATLQLLGPPGAQIASEAQARPAERSAANLVPVGPAPPRIIASPDDTLIEPLAGAPSGGLPRIAIDGRKPMHVYAGGSPQRGTPDRASAQPRVGLLLAGIGLNTADSQDAIRSLPAGVTLAISPYSIKPEALLEEARLNRHEYVLSLPLEPRGAPMNDAGNQALLTGASPEQNMRRLEWSLGRIAGYAGVTGALGAMRGERFSASAEPMAMLLRTVADRGLYFIDGRTPENEASASRAVPIAYGRFIDIVVDETPVRTDIDRQLARLEAIARERGSALGFASSPMPTNIGRIAVWATGLADRGIELVPVSALAVPPAEIATASRP